MASKEVQHIEPEIRYRLEEEGRVFVEQELLKLGAVLGPTTELVDEWYIPNWIRNPKEQKQWFDVERGLSMRIRSEYIKGKLMGQTFGTKQITNEHGHNALAQTENPIEDPAIERNKLLMEGRKNFLTIDKTRVCYYLTTEDNETVEVAIDTIANYGMGVELEYKGDKDVNTAMSILRRVALKLKLKPELELKESLTVEAMRTLAHY